jgi:sporulation protein YlmC with PRC-barrel domain
MLVGVASAREPGPEPKDAAGTQLEIHVKVGHEPHAVTFEIHKATDLIGREVINPDHRKVGKIEDLALDPDRGRIAYAVLSFGGFLGIHDKWFAVPWSSFDLRGDTLVLNTDKSTLKAAQGFDKDHWPDMANMEWARATYQHYGQKPYWEEDKSKPRLAGHEENGPLPANRIVRADEVLHMKVRNPKGAELGEVKDLGIDVQRARIAYAVLSSGGFRGMDASLFAVPWPAFGVETDKGPLILNVDRGTLEAGPRFPKGSWPEAQGEDFLDATYSYYKVPPYWATTDHKSSKKP